MNDSAKLLQNELGALLALLVALPEFLVAVLEVELALDVGEQEVGQQEDLAGFDWTFQCWVVPQKKESWLSHNQIKNWN